MSPQPSQSPRRVSVLPSQLVGPSAVRALADLVLRVTSTVPGAPPVRTVTSPPPVLTVRAEIWWVRRSYCSTRWPTPASATAAPAPASTSTPAAAPAMRRGWFGRRRLGGGAGGGDAGVGGAGATWASGRSWGPGWAGGQTGLSCGPDVVTRSPHPLPVGHRVFHHHPPAAHGCRLAQHSQGHPGSLGRSSRRSSARPVRRWSALRRTGGQERVRFPLGLGPMSAFVPVRLSATRARPSAVVGELRLRQ